MFRIHSELLHALSLWKLNLVNNQRQRLCSDQYDYDIQTFSALMEQKVNLYTLKENKQMKPNTFCNLVAYSLFEKRYRVL